jgi:hypothetical protein
MQTHFPRRSEPRTDRVSRLCSTEFVAELQVSSTRNTHTGGALDGGRLGADYTVSRAHSATAPNDATSPRAKTVTPEPPLTCDAKVCN